VDHAPEAHALALAHGVHADGGGEMALASAGAADEDHVARELHEVALVQITHEGFVDCGCTEVEPGKVLGERDLCSGQLVTDRAHLALGALRAHELSEDLPRAAVAFDA